KKSIGSPGGEVLEFIKTRDMAYIPGSSIKGAIRTAILWWVLRNDPSTFDRAKKHLDNLVRDRRAKRKFADKNIEDDVFGKEPTHDLLKALQVSDTNAVPAEKLEVREVRTLTTSQRGHDWKRFTTFLELLQLGTTLELDLHIDEFTLKDDIARVLHIDGKQDLLRSIPKICNEFAKSFIEYETRFYGKYNVPRELDDVATFYNELRHDIDGLRDNSFLLHFAWGSGWHGMTVGLALDRQTLEKVRGKFRLGKSYRDRSSGQWRLIPEFPKTRKIVLQNGRPMYPLGWIKLSVTE
ncbi:MAG: type III-A CRISPR-associated RAMP protein Csm5, partial [Methanocellales archaeon]|nr:type III-A CRISPR-associated RAMP protein Csm5 [Methanocellales archaeon]